MWKTILENILDIFFPKRCINCQKEGSYLCNDCLSLIEISPKDYCPFCYPPKETENGKTCRLHHQKNLDGLIAATSYQDKIVRKAILSLKYKPYIKDLAKPLTLLIIAHLNLLNNKPNFHNFVLVPIPSDKSRLKRRGFNQAEEIAKELAKSLKETTFSKNILIKSKKTKPQAELLRKGREKNIKGAFKVDIKRLDFIKNRKILLVDDVFTTGATMEEAAKVLKKAGASKVWGIVVAREPLN